MAAELIEKNGSSIPSTTTIIRTLTGESFHVSNKLKERYLSENIKDDFTVSSDMRYYGGAAIEKNSLQEFTNKIKPSNEIIDSLFSTRDFILNERWDKTINIHSRVIEYTNTIVSCECLVDKEKGIFENRIFPSYLFSHLKVEEKPFVIVNIKTKVGSSRIDIFDGSQIVDKKYFQVNDAWKEIESDDLNLPITGEIEL